MIDKIIAVDVVSDGGSPFLAEIVRQTGKTPSVLYYTSNLAETIYPVLHQMGYVPFFDSESYTIEHGRVMSEQWMKSPDGSFYLKVCTEEYSNTVIYHFQQSSDDIDQLIKLFNDHRKDDIPPEQARIHLIQMNKMQGLYTSVFKIRDPKVDITKHYNDDFAPVSAHIITELNKEGGNGIVILHGIPGSGKTNMCRYLSQHVKKKILFVPSYMTESLTSPQFIPFLTEHSDSVLLIEEAEKVLMSRDMMNGNDAVSNILNITDGILGDCINIQVIATFNTDKERIDPALLRDGRLIAQYKFEKLDATKANVLLEEQGVEFRTKEAMTLAEIYNMGKAMKSAVKEKKIGF